MSAHCLKGKGSIGEFSQGTIYYWNLLRICALIVNLFEKTKKFCRKSFQSEWVAPQKIRTAVKSIKWHFFWGNFWHFPSRYTRKFLGTTRSWIKKENSAPFDRKNKIYPSNILFPQAGSLWYRIPLTKELGEGRIERLCFFLLLVLATNQALVLF